MKYVRTFGAFWYDFIIGDDWTVAGAVVAAVAITAWLAHHDVNAWWFLPAAVIVGLAISVTRVKMTRTRPTNPPDEPGRT
jgi:hypothetical protein